MKIYTKTGDAGETSLFAGGRVRKSDIRVEAYGTADELNSFIGLARAYPLPDPAPEWLEQIQNDLFTVGADLATPNDAKVDWLVRLDAAAATRLETAIDSMDGQLTPLKTFILPGGTPAAATLHIARTVCRRCERICVDLAAEQSVNVHVLTYLNRLSDFLFTLARWVNQQAGESETKWSVRS
ncbi:MAG: cob(I)yrinic acid a,c-diamide adenosyltransferase [Chloroflexi bacterium]|nr:cob(I)yrinic acid a,c-diamide adenosyltransferase [Chloroflexota bacterium]